MTKPVPATPVAVIKRDGTRSLFDASRIQSAIQRAGAATAEFGEDEAQLITSQVLNMPSAPFSRKPHAHHRRTNTLHYH